MAPSASKCSNAHMHLKWSQQVYIDSQFPTCSISRSQWFGEVSNSIATKWFREGMSKWSSCRALKIHRWNWVGAENREGWGRRWETIPIGRLIRWFDGEVGVEISEGLGGRIVKVEIIHNGSLTNTHLCRLGWARCFYWYLRHLLRIEFWLQLYLDWNLWS